MTSLQIEKKKNYAIITINNGKVNAINTQMTLDLIETFAQLEKDDDVLGVVLTGRPHCFSAGVDLVSFSKGGTDGMKEFSRSMLTMVQALVRFPKPFVCAMTGYAPAGATLLALCADYRIMGRGEKHKMGMHEFKLSLQIPSMMCDLFSYYIGEKKAWNAVQKAKLFSSDEALEMGLVDESVEVEEVLPRAESYLQDLLSVHYPVLIKSKLYFRKQLLEIVDVNIDEVMEESMTEIGSPFYQQMFEVFKMGVR